MKFKRCFNVSVLLENGSKDEAVCGVTPWGPVCSYLRIWLEMSWLFDRG